MNYIEDARKQVRRYEHRLQQTKDALQLYTDLTDNSVLWTKAQLKEQEISYEKSLKSAQESLARIEKSRRERINEMTPEEKRKEYTRMCEEREAEKIDYVLMYGFDAWEKEFKR
jgi:1,4-dihydroxy-2-naphthoyl-CoA synthase